MVADSVDPNKLFGQQHIDAYVATDGKIGHQWNGGKILILTAKGRHSGEPRPMPLLYGRDGDNYLVVASKGGHPAHPVWYLNVVEHPDVYVQVLGERFRAHARTATPEEKVRLWPIMTREWPAYDDYQGKTDREIPLVILERSS